MSKFQDYSDPDSNEKYTYHFSTDLEAQDIPPAEWLIEDILLEETVAIMAASGESGKTFMAIDMCYSMATCTPWCNKKVKCGATAYITAEGKRGFGKRGQVLRSL
jgi:RecA-family ATPase